MEFPMNFIAASKDFSTLDNYVPAPYLRKTFILDKILEKAEICICGLGFYDLFINGKKITKGALAPYISAPDDIIYYDSYDVTNLLAEGENVIGVCLGNGMQNCLGGYVWDFDKARWRGAPQMALKLEVLFEKGETFSLESDESFRTTNSPIFFDDLRNGEYYDGRKELPGWTKKGYDDSAWGQAIKAPMPRGEAILCKVDPIIVTYELKPVSVTAQDEGYLYDFGVNLAGLCRLQLSGIRGQEISLYHGEYLVDGKLNMRTVAFDENDYVQKDIYICKGEEEERYIPSFTYHGFQYVFVKGLTKEQATKDALTYLVMNSDLKEMGNFNCSDETINALQTMTRRSTLANFFYFPTDCPHREKNGWTGDAAISAEHTLLNLNPENSYLEWLRNIRKAQDDRGTIPGIVPTGGWGFNWGNGPAWDAALTYLPYYTYQYRGDKEILKENAHAIFRYLDFLSSVIREDGLINIGLGDWCPAGRNTSDYQAPVEFTDTVISMDICRKAASIFNVLGKLEQESFAKALGDRLYKAARKQLLNLETFTAKSNCQTAQAMAIYYSLFDPSEKPIAVKRLVEMIKQNNDFMDVGILGGRVLFHVLAEYGYTDLAYKMIVTPEFPSYGHWVALGATTLWEDFRLESEAVNSRNHHFWGDISNWFLQHLAGIRYNPQFNNHNEVNIKPHFIKELEFAEGFHVTPAGKIEVIWKRQGDLIQMEITVPHCMIGSIVLDNGYVFENGKNQISVQSGTYVIQRSKSC